jgi:hypothetical protein
VMRLHEQPGEMRIPRRAVERPVGLDGCVWGMCQQTASEKAEVSVAARLG